MTTKVAVHVYDMVSKLLALDTFICHAKNRFEHFLHKRLSVVNSTN